MTFYRAALRAMKTTRAMTALMTMVISSLVSWTERLDILFYQHFA